MLEMNQGGSTTDLPQVVLTERAAQVFKESCLAEGKEVSTAYFRIGAHPGGCSGYKYDLAYNSADEVKNSDVKFLSNGVNVVVDRTCLMEVIGPVEIDFTDKNLVEQGFVFKQMVAGRQCGCGESFTAVKDLG